MLSLHQDQTIHPAENFISMNLFQNFFFDNIGLNEIQLHPWKKRPFLVLNVKNVSEGVRIFGFLLFSKLFLIFKASIMFNQI